MAKQNRNKGLAAQPAGAHTRVAYLVGRLDRVLRRRIAEVTGHFGLTVPQYTALSFIYTRGQLSNAQLAQRAFMTPQAMSEVIKAMEQKKIIVRQPDPVHGRIVQLRLTKSGEALLLQCDAAVQQLEDAMLAHLSEQERADLQKHLRTCIHALDALV